MSLKERLTPKTGYAFLALIWLVISVHVGYLYISFSSHQVEDKGGTFIEATTDSTNYLPYTSVDDNDKFYQSLLFNGCLYPTIEGTDITYRDELCTVTTQDYQRFEVKVIDGKKRSDGRPITLNDVLFTYKTILKDNYRNIGSLDAFRNIIIKANTEERTLTVTFPNPSIDNMIFFTNFILPSHLLANQTLEHYISTFYQDPITSTCVVLQKNLRDTTNTVFDLSNCSTTLLKYYQVKTFDTQNQAIEYVTNNPDTIDLIFSDVPFEGYSPNKVILNKFITLFFNTQNLRMKASLRKNITGLFNTIFDEATMDDGNDLMIRDRFLFDSVTASGDLKWLTSQELLGSYNDIQEIGTPDSEIIPPLPEKMIRGGNNPEEQEYRLEEKITDKVVLKLVFSKPFDKISITVNDGIEYYPSTYNKLTQSSLYNLNPLYRNIVQGRNIYTIKGYENDVHTETYRFIIYYLDTPNYPTAETNNSLGSWDPIEIIYYTDSASQAIVDTLQAYFRAKNIEGYFTFQGFGDTNTFEGKITSLDYDIVIRSINMGLRKDISNLFTSSVPTINPSVYTNQELADSINKYFLSSDEEKESIKETIDTIYEKDVPLIVLGKELGTIAIRESLKFPYPKRLYVLGWRRDFIDAISIFDHISINRDNVFQIDNFFSFLGQYF